MAFLPEAGWRGDRRVSRPVCAGPVRLRCHGAASNPTAATVTIPISATTSHATSSQHGGAHPAQPSSPVASPGTHPGFNWRES